MSLFIEHNLCLTVINGIKFSVFTIKYLQVKQVTILIKKRIFVL